MNIFATLFITSTCSSILTCILLLYLKKWIPYITENLTKGVQKFHTTPAIRIGGISIAVACVISILTLLYILDVPISIHEKTSYKYFCIIIVLFYAIGFLEDLTKSMTPITRLFLMIITSILAYNTLDIKLLKIGIPYLDNHVFIYNIISLSVVTIFFTKITNAFNIIDGFNGLMLGYSVLVLLSLIYIAHDVHSINTLYFSYILLGGILGLFFFNIPFGYIFSGDGGAYLLGIALSIISLLMMQSTEVSIWSIGSLLAYPICEVYFSIFRKLFIKRISPLSPDNDHFHMLIYQIIARASSTNNKIQHLITSILIYIFAGIPTLLTIFYYQNTMALIIIGSIFATLYFIFYYLLYQYKYLTK